MLIPFSECICQHGRQFNGVVHIGAHLGEEAEAYAAGGVERVLWVEANEDLMEPLRRATAGFPMQQTYICAALSDAPGTVTFRITNNGQSSSILPLGTHATHYPHIMVVEQREIQTKRFDSLGIELEPYDFLNLDVQGAELKVLRGFKSLDNFSAVYAEVNFEEVYVGAPLMAEIDTHLTGFQRVAHNDTGQGWGDALYLRR